MSQLRLKNGFGRLNDSELETRTSQIITAMDGNPNFTAPVPDMLAMQSLFDAYVTALSACGDGNRLKVAIKNQKRDALVAALHQWSYYVLLTSNNDMAKAVSSGFQIARQPMPQPPLVKPDAPILESGINSGDIVSKGKRIDGAVSYEHQFATETEMQAGNWKSIPSSAALCTITGLVPGTRYYCRLVVIGRRQQVVYSDVVWRIAA